MSNPGLGALLVVLHACIDIKGTIMDKFHYLLFYLGISMNPRYLSTVDTDLKPVSVTVRVGQAVETVGQAGRPKTITGFQVCLQLVCNVRQEIGLINFTLDAYYACTSRLQGQIRISEQRIHMCRRIRHGGYRNSGENPCGRRFSQLSIRICYCTSRYNYELNCNLSLILLLSFYSKVNQFYII